MNLFKFVSLMLICSPLFALQSHMYPGGIAVIDVGEFDTKPKIFYKSKEAKVIKEDGKYTAVIGLGLKEKAGKKHIVAVGNGLKKDFYFQLKSKSYKKEYIKLKTNKRVSLSKKNLDRYHKEKAKSKKITQSFNRELATDFNFIAPLIGRKSSPFGKRRYFNNKPKAPHSGVDIAAKRGTPIKAAQSGFIEIQEEYFFNGNTIYLDHGEGMVSIYCHMKNFEVEKGDFVNQGDIIGYVGTTGRSTGPHLHFGLILNGVSVDPAIFIDGY